MGSDKLYRWEKRRIRKLRDEKSFHLTSLDWVMLTLISVVFFVSLRLFFLFEVTSAPCAEMILTIGAGSGLPPIFKLTYWISLLLGLFWLCVTLNRVLSRRANWALISWHSLLFISIFFLAVTNRNLTASTYVNPPDGVMVVENKTPIITVDGTDWQSPKHMRWAQQKDGQWYAHGSKACIWLDENKVSYNNRFDIERPSNMAFEFMFKGRSFEILKANQLYRPLTDFERGTFLNIQSCKADIMKYRQHRSACISEHIYSVAPELKPSPEFLETWPTDP